MEIIAVSSEGDLSQVRDLFLEYAASLGFDLDFQNFDESTLNLVTGESGIFLSP